MKITIAIWCPIWLLRTWFLFSVYNTSTIPYSSLYTSETMLQCYIFLFCFEEIFFVGQIIASMLITYFIRGNCQFIIFMSVIYLSCLSYCSKLLFHWSIWHLFKLVYYWPVLGKTRLHQKLWAMYWSYVSMCPKAFWGFLW